jgi:alcohol dehydrogenase, propanol-preferring
VGLGRTQATISTMELIARRVTLRGSGGGQPQDTARVLEHMESGALAIEATTIAFAGIPDGLMRLERGGMVGRIVAAID